jgi:hypothetical protein
MRDKGGWLCDILLYMAEPSPFVNKRKVEIYVNQ